MNLDKSVREALDDHIKWINSGGAEGERLDLTGKNLSKAVFDGVDFSEAEFHGANFRGAIINRDTRFSDRFIAGRYKEIRRPLAR